MDLFVSLDPTAVCVGLLVLALTLLWAYVSLSGSRREQPKLSVLYEQTTLRPVSGQNKAGKAKGKGKQVEGSPRPSVQKKTNAETTPGSSQKPAAQPDHDRGSDPSTTRQSGKGKKKRQGTQHRADVEVVAKAKPQVEEGEEGEWQTQLSRGQLKALRQKKRKEEKEKAKKEQARKSSSSDSDGKQTTPKGEGTSGRQKNGKAVAEKKEPSKSEEGSVTKDNNDSERKAKGSTNGQKTTSEKSQTISAEATKTTASTEKDELVKPSEGKAKHTAWSPAPTSTAAPVSVGVSDVEEALKDAARSTSTSPEEDAQSAKTEEAAFTKVVSSRHKKSQQKTPPDSPKETPNSAQETPNPAQEQTHEEEDYHDEDWVVIDGDSLT